MNRPIIVEGAGRTTALVTTALHRYGRPAAWTLAVAAAVAAAALWAWGGGRAGGRGEGEGGGPAPAPTVRPREGDGVVPLGPGQQKAIGLRTVRAATGDAYDRLSAPGRVAPNETKYAFITPRAAGVVRAVLAHLGQDVKAGDLLATIDSPEVGEARLELYTRLQALELARAQADWQGKIHASTLDLLERLRKQETPQAIHDALADRAVGENRERLMSAYAQYRLAVATIARNRELHAQRLITTKQFEKVTAEYEVAQSAYQSLMDQTGYESRLANTRAQQGLKQAEASVRAAQERLRILGVKPDGTEPEVEQGRVVGVDRDGTIAGPGEGKGRAPAAEPERILPGDQVKAIEPVGAHPGGPSKPKDTPVSTYSIWAPFDGTILDREMIVPGVAVDTTHRIFTMADLATVWVEASVRESDFDTLDIARSRGASVRFRTPAYPERVFEGEVIYTGDLVEQSRTVKLLARAKNPERLLRPGMFVEIEVLSPRTVAAIQIPRSALLVEGDVSFVYVRVDPDRFGRRVVEAEEPRGDTVVIRRGLSDGDEVVVEGGFALKAVSERLAFEGR